jgi:hypothetical protein
MIGRRAFFGLLAALTLGAASMPTPKSQCEDLLNAVLPFAEKMLAEHGEFYPFGASLKSDGTIAQTAAYDGREHPPSQPLIDMLHDGFSAEAKAGAIIASATVYDVRVVTPGTTEKTDAVKIELDHRDNYSVVVYFPYKIEAGKVRFAQTFAEKGGFRVFPGHGI